MQDLNAPLYNAIIKAARDSAARFCMPGHSGKGDGLYADARYDLTEIAGLDNMLCPEGVIAQAQRLAAEAYGAERALFFTAGATSAVHTALAVAKDKGPVYAIGRLHKSFYGGCDLTGTEPVRFEGIDDFVASSVSGGTAFFTYVDYFGNTADDGPLVAFCRARGVTSVADSAHGAHFAFCSRLPRLSRADVAIYGMHKTLPVYGGGALMTARSERYADEAAFARQLVHTTSPSYLVMASMDLARARYARDGEDIFARIYDARRRFEQCDLGAFKVASSDDFSRLVLINEGFDASEFSQYLLERGIYAEAAIQDRTVFILTENNADMLPALADAAARFVPARKLPAVPSPQRRERKSARGQIDFVPLSDVSGRICAGEIGLYPPGVPYIGRGEVFTREDAEFLQQHAGMLFGLVNGRAVVVK